MAFIARDYRANRVNFTLMAIWFISGDRTDSIAGIAFLNIILPADMAPPQTAFSFRRTTISYLLREATSPSAASRHCEIMNTKKTILLGSALIACAGFQSVADNVENDERQARDAVQTHIAQRIPRPDVAVKASQILGREIRDENGHKIGKVRELALDLQNGRIAEVIVGTGGFLGIEERNTALPPEEFSWNPDTKKLTCQLDGEQLRNAPAFDTSQWFDSVTPEKVREIYHRYDVTPYFIDERVPTPPATEVKPALQLTSAGLMAPTAHLGRIERSRTIIGAPVRNLQEEDLGKAENVILDVAAGRVVVIIVSTGNFLDMGNEVSAIPPQAFHFDADKDKLHLNTTREALRTAPHFKPDQWPAVASSERIAEVYNAYDIPLYAISTDADDTAQNVRSTLTPLQGTSASDRAITARIRREIMSRPDLSTDAQNVRVITVDGQVTLRGPVRNKEEEQKIIEIARNAVAQNTKVTNQIQTIGEPPKTGTKPAPEDLK